MEDVREECTMQNIVTEIETMFCDEEYGFEVYALIKGDEIKILMLMLLA